MAGGEDNTRENDVVENYEPISEASQIVPMNQSQADKAKTALG